MKKFAVAVSVVLSLSAFAAAPVGSVRVGGGLDVRNSKFDDVPVSGLLVPQLRVDADGWFLPWLGVEVDLSTQFAGVMPGLESSGLTYTAGRAGLAVRHHFESGFSLRAGLGWGGASFPVRVSRDGMLVPTAITSSGVSARIEVGFETGRFQGAVSGALMVPLVGSHSVFTVEPRLWLAVRMFDVASSHWWLGVDGAALSETGGTYSGLTGRVGIGLRITLDDFKAPENFTAPPLPLDATVELRVVDDEGAPVNQARVWVDEAIAGVTDGTGQLRLTIPSGEHPLRVQREGLREKRERLQLRDGELKKLELKLSTPTGPGSVVGTVFDAVSRKPIANARIAADGREVRSTADGSFRVAGVGPGPVRVHVEIPGYAQLEEVAQVPAEAEARLSIGLEPVGRGTPAVIRGLIRARTGVSVNATVRVQGQSEPVPLNAEGRFELSLKPGSYTLTVTAPGYVAQAKRFDLSAGEQAVFHCELLKL
ncbi:MAG: carboxypeptidase regulatory-like domain-containing protein [Archangium sp.]